ncbi:zinc finger and BTB domain-containing protein 40 [Anomaloglossus baeobatrachus]|uniref:zinc finger and BTB domain-containing protein 40 n=1 Tax=Anomaloglossus baeobatrachus TaxID=238106 RepID=UPI003F4F7F4B
MELPNYSRQLLQQVYTLCKEQQFCDCTIFVGSLHFRAHKLVLSAASLLFKSLLETTETISIDASVVTPDEFSLLLEMMYSGKLPPGKHNLTKIISVADSLQMFDVAVSCKNLLTELMNHSTQSQKKEVPVQPLTVLKADLKPVVPRSNVASETLAIEKTLSPMSAASSSVLSAHEQQQMSKLPSPTLLTKKLDANSNLQPSCMTIPDGSTDHVMHDHTVPEQEEHWTDSTNTERTLSPSQIDPASALGKSDNISSPEKPAMSPHVPPVDEICQKQSSEEEADEVGDAEFMAAGPEAASCTSAQDSDAAAEETAEPAAKRRRLDDPEAEKTSGELDFLIRYESIFSEALSDPQSVLENLSKCREINEAERQAVAECCQAEEGSSTFAKLLEKVKAGQSIVVETVLALLKLCRDTNPSVNEALREQEPQEKDSEEEQLVETELVEKEKTLFDLLIERREELIQCITELSPIIECLDTAEEDFLTNIEKKVIMDCCESGSHKKAMDKLLRKASETKTLSPDSLIKLLQAVREAFPDLHTLLDILEPHSKKSAFKGKMSMADYGAELLKQYQENLSEVINDADLVLGGLSSTSNLTDHEKEVVENIVRKNCSTRIFSILMSCVFDEQTLSIGAIWQLLLAMQELNPAVKSLMDEIRKEPGADVFFQSVMNRENELAEVLVRHSELIAQAFRHCDVLSFVSPDDGALNDLVKQMLKIPQQNDNEDFPAKLLLSSALQHTVPVLRFCQLLSRLQDSVPDLQPLIKSLEELGKMSMADYGAELLKQYQENLSEVVNDADLVLGGLSSTSNLTDQEKEVVENIVRKNCSTRIFSILMSCVFEEQTVSIGAIWQLLLEMQELSPAVKSLMDEIRKEPGADVFFHSVMNRENELAEVLVHHSELIAQVFRHCDVLSFVSPDDDALNDLVKQMLNIPQQNDNEDFPAKLLLSSALQHTVPVLKFCQLLCSLQDSVPDLQPLIKSIEELGLLVDGKCNFLTAMKWGVNNECQLEPMEEVGDRNEQDEEAKDDENDDVDSEKERAEFAQEKGSKKSFICKSCDKIFLFRCRLEVHMKRCRMAKRNPLQCKDCNVVQASKRELDQHREEVHGFLMSRNNKGKKKMLVTCDICGKEFAHPSGLQYHKRTEHFDEKPFSCEDCGAKFAANSTLKNHQRLHTGERPFVCKHCHMTFTQAAALSYHTKKKHSEGKMYVCQYCDAVFAQSIELTRHVRTHTGDKPYVCRECGKGFSQANGLSIHLRTFHDIEDPYDCQKCRMSFPTLEENRQHIQIVHSKEYHPCPSCEKIFSAPSLLERHIVTHVGGKPYNCEICDKAYQQLSGLWYHNRTHHPDLFAAQNHRSSKFSSAQCSSCEQVFTNPSTLQKHTKMEHPGECVTDNKAYECEKCEQTYPSSAALQVHIKCKHSGTQPFQCLYCSECFQFPGALQHHVSTDHFNETENTFGCDLCGELFTSQTQLEKHYETDHPDIVLAEQAANAQVVQVIQAEDTGVTGEQVITLDESQLAGSQVIVALPDPQSSQAAGTELVAVSMEDLFDGTVTLICGDAVPGVTQRTQS